MPRGIEVTCVGVTRIKPRDMGGSSYLTFMCEIRLSPNFRQVFPDSHPLPTQPNPDGKHKAPALRLPVARRLRLLVSAGPVRKPSITRSDLRSYPCLTVGQGSPDFPDFDCGQLPHNLRRGFERPHHCLRLASQAKALVRSIVPPSERIGIIHGRQSFTDQEIPEVL